MTKKILSGTLAAAISLSMTAYAAASTIPGDANNDGSVNARDALAILKHVAGSAKLIGQGLSNADANNDGKVTASDALKILKDVVGSGTPSTPSTPGTPASDFEIKDTGSAITITKYKGSGTDVVIPSKINGKPVTVIDEYAFFNCKNIQSIVVPEGVVKIGDSAFGNCENVKSISIPESVTEIEEGAFYCCRSLESVNLPKGLKKIGRAAFDACAKLKKITLTPEDTLPAGLKEIPENMFSGCRSMLTIIIPDGVTSIGTDAFRNCGSIYVSIPNSVTSIADGAFYYSKACFVKYKGKTYSYANINDLYKAING